MKRIAILIINYNGKRDTIECLKSIEKFVIKSDNLYKIYLLDNNSKAPICVSELSKFNVEIHYFSSDQNLGFAGGNNFLYKKSFKDNFDYFGLINNDTVICDNSFDLLIQAMENDSKLGIGGIINYYYSKPETVWQDGNDLQRTKFRIIKKRYEKYPDGLIVQTDCVPGSSLFVKNEVCEKIGFLDDNYFAYFEDVDFCLRAKAEGYSTGFLTGTRILHKVGMSSTSLHKSYLRNRNELYFCHKFGNIMSFILIVIRQLLTEIKFGINENQVKKRVIVWILSITDYFNGNMEKGSLEQI